MQDKSVEMSYYDDRDMLGEHGEYRGVAAAAAIGLGNSASIFCRNFLEARSKTGNKENSLNETARLLETIKDKTSIYFKEFPHSYIAISITGQKMVLSVFGNHAAVLVLRKDASVMVYRQIGVNKADVNKADVNEAGVNEAGVNEAGVNEVDVNVDDWVILLHNLQLPDDKITGAFKKLKSNSNFNVGKIKDIITEMSSDIIGGVVQVPSISKDVELVKVLIEHPEKAPMLLPEIQGEMLKEAFDAGLKFLRKGPYTPDQISAANDSMSQFYDNFDSINLLEGRVNEDGLLKIIKKLKISVQAAFFNMLKEKSISNWPKICKTLRDNAADKLLKKKNVPNEMVQQDEKEDFEAYKKQFDSLNIALQFSLFNMPRVFAFFVSRTRTVKIIRSGVKDLRDRASEQLLSKSDGEEKSQAQVDSKATFERLNDLYKELQEAQEWSLFKDHRGKGFFSFGDTATVKKFKDRQDELFLQADRLLRRKSSEESADFVAPLTIRSHQPGFFTSLRCSGAFHEVKPLVTHALDAPKMHC